MGNVLATGVDSVTGQTEQASVNNVLTGPGSGTDSERFGANATIGTVAGAVAVGKSTAIPTGATANSIVVGNGSAFTAIGGGIAIGTQTTPVAFTKTTAIGLGVTSGSQRSILIGDDTSTSPGSVVAGGNIAIGYGAFAGNGGGNVAIGDQAFSSGLFGDGQRGGVAIGLQAFTQYSSICIGYQSYNSGNNQFAAGRSANPITDVTFGAGVRTPLDTSGTASANYSILGTGGYFNAEAVDPVSAPTGTVVAAGGGTFTPGTYEVKYAYHTLSENTDDIGETLPSPASTPFTIVTLGDKIVLTAIPDPLIGAGYVAIYVETASASGVFLRSTAAAFDVAIDVINPGTENPPHGVNDSGSNGHAHNITISGGRAAPSLTTQVGASSEGVDLNGAAEIYTGFPFTSGFPPNGTDPASKVILVDTDAGPQTVTYTSLNVDGIRFMGPFTATAGSIMHTGNSITQLFPPSGNSGGLLTLSGGTSVEGNGANVSIAASDGVTSLGNSQNGGSVNINAGAATGTGTTGVVTIQGLPVSSVLSITTVDLKSVSTTGLYTVPSGRSVIVTDAIVKPTTATAAAGDGIMGIGVAAGEDDIFLPETITATLTTVRFKFSSNSLAVVPAAGDVILAGVDSADTGTALVVDVYLFGYLI
jgi:hypothetical protein